MSKDREELNKKKAEQKKGKLKSNLMKVGGIIAAVSIALLGHKINNNNNNN